MQKHLALVKALIVVAGLPAYADFCADQGAFSWPTTTGNFTPVTGSPCTPKVLILTWNIADEDSARGSYSFGFGIGVSSTSRASIYGRSSDGSINADGTHSNNRILRTINESATAVNAGDLVSLNSDGFTLNAIAVNSTVISRVRWLTLGGSDLSNVSLVQYQSPTSAGSQALTGAGFAPDAVIIFTNSISTAPTSTVSNGDTYPGIGYAARIQGGQAALGVSVLHTANTETRAQSTSDVVYVPSTSAMLWQASVSSWDTDGITLNWSTVQSTAVYFWVLYLKGPQFAVASTTQPTASGNTSITGLSFQPSAGIFSSFCRAATSGQIADGNWGHGFAVSSTKRGFVWASMRSGNNNSSQATGQSFFISCYTENSTTPTLRSRADFVSWNSDGMTMSWTVNEATQRQVIAFLAGASSAGPPPRVTNPSLITE